MDIWKELIFRVVALILLWTCLVMNSCEIILSAIFTFEYLINSSSIKEVIYQFIRGAYFLIELIVGIFILQKGTRGVNDNVPELLEETFYYNCYLAVYRVIAVTVLAINFTWYRKLIPTYKDNVVFISDGKLSIILEHLLAFGFNIGMAAVVKSCADIMNDNRLEMLNENKGDIAIPRNNSMGCHFSCRNESFCEV